MLRQRHQRTAPLHAVPLAICVGVTVVGLVVLMLVAVGIGSVSVPLGDTWRIVISHLTGREPGGDLVFDQIVWDFRVPRVLLAALCGAGLAVAGVLLQALVDNPLAEPYVLGLVPGASVGAVVVITVGAGAVGGVSVSFAAFAGAMIAGGLVFALGQQQGRLAPTRLVLSGVAVGYVFLAVTSYLQLKASPSDLRRVMFWLLGSVAGAQWDQLGLVAAVILVSTCALLLTGRRLNAMVTGDETATALGVDVRKLRIGLLTVAALLTGTVSGVAGGVSFVGLLIPHVVRLAFGVDHRRVLPLSALVGAGYLVLVDLLSRTVDSPNELPIGIFTAAFGAPFLLWLMRRNKSVAAGP
ncbi:FecCD family ABC transporter permease [Actinocrispum wychmicini]|uniref:Iron complex transport system permease protein n=1 Tax=Actinocrispum wychmicini TaxID=1213861 RepID=A0A4R2JPG3_9PSEU|nr:iron ABC transporter permease [Actinocrispum wychmicini]TCO60652.1 iron complex transport system permease protein [Actinocrispum wychmicini]